MSECLSIWLGEPPALPGWQQKYESRSRFVHFPSSRKDVRRAWSMSTVPTGFRMNCWFLQPHTEARG